MDREQLADTQNGCKLTLAMIEAAGDEGAEFVRYVLPIPESDKGKGTTSKVASPNLSEFERYLDGCEKESTSITKKKSTRLTKAKDKVDSDEEDDLETFGNLLVRERAKRQRIAGENSPACKILLTRPEDNQHSRVVEIDDIIPEARSDDDEVPIVSNLKISMPKCKGNKNS